MGQRTDDPFTRLAHTLAAWPDMIERLMAEHPTEGVCTGCTTPGGRAVIMGPCSIRSLAELAATIRTMKEGRR